MRSSASSRTDRQHPGLRRGAHEDDREAARACDQIERPCGLHQHDEPADHRAAGHRRFDRHRHQHQFVTTGPVEFRPERQGGGNGPGAASGTDRNVRADLVTRRGPDALCRGGERRRLRRHNCCSRSSPRRIRSAPEELFAELKEQAAQLLERGTSKASSHESVTFLPLSPTFTPFVGEVSDELFLSMSVQAVGLSIDEAGQRDCPWPLAETMPPGTRLILDTVRFTSGCGRGRRWQHQLLGHRRRRVAALDRRQRGGAGRAGVERARGRGDPAGTLRASPKRRRSSWGRIGCRTSSLQGESPGPAVAHPGDRRLG